MTPDAILNACMERLADPSLSTLDVLRIRLAASFAWQEKEMGGIEHVQFSYANGTPIVPPGDPCHPVQLQARGYRDGIGWPKRILSSP